LAANPDSGDLHGLFLSTTPEFTSEGGLSPGSALAISLAARR
jgi:hypothetical protein